MDPHLVLKNDPVLWWLHRKLKLNWFGIMIFFLAASLLMIPWAQQIEVWNYDQGENFLLATVEYPLKVSLHTWVGNGLLALCNGLVLLFYLAIPPAFAQLLDQGVLTHHQNKAKEAISGLLTPRLNHAALFLGFLLSLALHLLYLLDNRFGWTELGTGQGLNSLGFYHLLFLAVQISIVLSSLGVLRRVYLTLCWIDKEVEQGRMSYHLVRLCPQSAGGLYPLGALGLRFIFIFAGYGGYLWILVYAVRSYLESSRQLDDSWLLVEMWIPLVLYLVLVPLCTLYPLSPVVRLMKRQVASLHQGLIQEDQKLLNLEAKSFQAALANPDTSQALARHQEMHQILAQLPTFPYNLGTMRSLLLSTLLPAVAYGLDLFFKLRG